MNKVLITGGSGKLGSAIINSKLFNEILSPSSKIFDITNSKKIEEYFYENKFDVVIHCAAVARLKEAHNNPSKAINVNLVGTSNLVNAVLSEEIKEKRSIRFIQISTDGVYESVKGPYSESHETKPYSIYGWTKLGAECAVRTLKNYCIIRTSFFDPENIPFMESAIDAYSSRIPVKDVAQGIHKIANINFVGVINLGGPKKSHYDLYREYKPSLKPCKYEDTIKNLDFKLPKDSSMDCSLWNSLI